LKVTAILLAIMLLPFGAAAQTPASAPTAIDSEALYAALRGVEFDGAQSLALENMSLQRGPAVFHFDSGVWIPLHAVGERVTGAVFLGDGRFGFTPPPGVEQGQLVKFAESSTLDERFTALYLRFTDATAQEVASGAVTEGRGGDLGRARDFHKDRREELLEKENLNLDARLLTDLLDDRHDSFYAWIDTREHGLLSFRVDPTAPDHYTLAKWSNRFGGILDVWSALGPAPIVPAPPSHYVIDVTLDGEEFVEARTEVRFQATESQRASLRFTLSPLVELREVLDAGGSPLFFVREQVGRKEWESSVTVAFPEALPTDAATSVTFVFGGDIIDKTFTGEFALKAPVFWYPSLGDLERATYEMTFRVDENQRVFASGDRVSDEVIDGVRIVRFTSEMPVAFVSFNYGKMDTETVEIEGAPPVTVFGRGSGRQLRDVGIDVANSIHFYNEMYGEYPFSYMYATSIPYAHGQGFPGLLHLSAGTFGNEVKGATEAFRSHEVAHQWWGHIVGWATYRDQWISEGFAEYSGALYATMYNQDPEILDRMTVAWRNDIFGKSILRAGPISLGRRLVSSDSQFAYSTLIYEKGAYVLHMIRMLFFDFRAGNDEPFRAMMRDFVETHRGGEASTDDFRRAVERHAGIDMGWFFDQWVYGTAIPTYRYAWTTERGADGGVNVKLRVRQTVEPNVPFHMFVPVRVEFGEGRSSVLRIPVNEPEHIFEFSIPMEPTEVIFNHANAVLARVTKENW